ncbi:ClpP/crotonase-like domain-containing protein [Gautieria morchelliformis]|nr:ClpP/crotonase-like domain-containing protein [Gautieria morchelliformis]
MTHVYPLHVPEKDQLLTITHPSPSLWIIELRHGEDNRLTEHFIQSALLPALDHVELVWRNSFRDAKARKDTAGGRGALVITGKRSQEKFFSNGFDYPQVVNKPGFIKNTFNVLLARLLSFPIPTVAAINGHVFAAGFIVALACDYRVITSDKKRRVWGCMNEVHFGAPLPHSFSEMLRSKSPDQQTLRKIALEGHRFTPSELLASGLVDIVVDGGSEAVLARASEIAEQWSVNACTGVWGLIKKGLYKDVIRSTQEDPRAVHADEEDSVARARL